MTVATLEDLAAFMALPGDPHKLEWLDDQGRVCGRDRADMLRMHKFGLKGLVGIRIDVGDVPDTILKILEESA